MTKKITSLLVIISVLLSFESIQATSQNQQNFIGLSMFKTDVMSDIGKTLTDNASYISSNLTSNIIFATANENQNLVLQAPSGTIITAITFASYGNPTGTDGNFSISNCHAANSITIVEGYAIGNNSATIPATNSVFGDPCFGTAKKLYVTATYSNTDTTPPSISLIGSNPQTVELGTAYSELGATATDDTDGDISGNISIDASAVDVNAIGEYSVTYNVSDAANNAAVEVIRTVLVKKPEPTAVDDTFDVIRNSTNNALDVLANDDFGFNGPNLTHPLTFANGALTNASVNGGSVSIGNNGTPNDLSDDVIIYTPPAGYIGEDTITYVITDFEGLAKTGLVTVDVINDANQSYAVDDTINVNENSSVVAIDILSNDTIGQDGISAINLSNSNTSLNGGTLSINDKGTPEKTDDEVNYTPAQDFTGIDSFVYTLVGNNGNTSSATVTINVNAVAPTTSTFLISPFILGLAKRTNNQSLSDYDISTYLGLPAGSVLISASNLHVSGNWWRFNSGYGLNPSTITITSSHPISMYYTHGTRLNGSSNKQPTKGFKVISENLEFTSASSNTSQGMTDTSLGNTYTVQNQTGGYHTNATDFKWTANGMFTNVTLENISDEAYHGNFFKIYLQIPPYALPTAEDDTVTVIQDSGVSIIDVLDNDKPGADGYIDGGLTMTNGTLTSASLNGGTISIDNKGTGDVSDDEFNYTPAAGFFGADSFQYTITDASGDASTATVNVTVTAITNVPVADDDTFIVDQDSSNNVLTMLANDTFGSDGYAALNPIVAITPTVQGGSAVVVENGTPEATDNTIIYNPPAGYHGPDSITYTLTDANGDQSTATITINITPAVVDSGIPTAVDDTANATQNGSDVNILVLANDDFGAEGPNTTHALTFKNGSTSNASTNGALISVNDNGTPNVYDDDYIVYTPSSSFVGEDNFTYVITDLSGDAAEAIVTITVGGSGGNSLPTPTANDDTGSVSGNSGVTVIDVLANDLSGSDGYIDNGLTMTNGTYNGASANGGAISVETYNTDDTGDHKINYTPPTGFTGTDTFQYTITDANGDAATATVYVSVSEPNEISATDDLFSVDTNSSNNVLDVFGNDAGVLDGNGDPNVTITGLVINGIASSGNVISLTNGTIQQIDGGVLSFNDDHFHYTPSTNYTGVETFTYVISFGNGETTSADVTINVVAISTNNGSPTANDDTASADQNGNTITIDVLDNDNYGLDGPNTTHPITFVNGDVTAASDNGAMITVANNMIEYTPTLLFSGTDTFEYRITDGSGDASFATVTVNVASNGTIAVPTANDDAITVDQDSSNNIVDVLGNDDPGIEGYIDGGLTMVNGTLSNASEFGGFISIDNKGTGDVSDDEFFYTPPTGFSGTDTFQYTITDASGDAATATVTITVSALSTPRNGNNQTGIEFNNSFTVHPNPTSNGSFSLSIESSNNVGGEVVIYDAVGKVIYRKSIQLNQGRNSIPMNLNVSSRIVVIKVMANSKYVGTKKLIIN